MPKRLKSLDEGPNIKMINDVTLNEAIHRNASKSKTYAHNKKVLNDLKGEGNKKVVPLHKPKKEPTVFELVLRNLCYISIIIIAVIFLISIAR